MKFLELINEKRNILDDKKYIKLVSHYDADGISSAAIISTALYRMGKKFSVRIVKRVSERLVEELNNENPDMVIFSDIGSSYDLRNLKVPALVLDHHNPKKLYGKNVVEINPMNFKIEELSGSGVSYLFFKDFNRFNNRLSYLAISGAVGDIRPMVGMNYTILRDAESCGMVKLSKSLNVFGTSTRSIHKSLYLNDVLPNVNSESSSIQFLSGVGIDIKKNGKWRTLDDLSEDEMRKLVSAIIAERVRNGLTNHNDVFAMKMKLTNVDMDINEFATILNAFGRMDKYYDGVRFAMNPDKRTAMKIYKDYRMLIGRYIRWAKENVPMEKFTIINADKNINPNFIGIICSMIIKSENVDTIIGMADDGDMIKISARSKFRNMSSFVNGLAEKFGGEAGGHMEAAGASIPIEKKNDVLEELERISREMAIHK